MPAKQKEFIYSSLQFIKGVGPRKAADLKRAGLSIVQDLLYRLPFRYEDRTKAQLVASLRPGHRAAVHVKIVSTNLTRTRRQKFTIFHAVVSDKSGSIRCTWMNQGYLKDILRPQQSVVIFGEIKLGSTGLHFMNPEYEFVGGDDPGKSSDGIHTGRIVPFYERAGSVTPNMQRKLVRLTLDKLPGNIPELLPAKVVARSQLVARRTALEEAHFPLNETNLELLNKFRSPAQRRLIFEEFFLFQIAYAWQRYSSGIEQKPFVVRVNERIRTSAARSLPFKLTPGQKEAVKEIVEDMQQSKSMHRLLQGDVGSGKTIVALLAAIVAMENGLQVAFMAPTEILAVQHFQNISKLLSHSKFKVDLFIGGMTSAKKEECEEKLKEGVTQLVVGTHALVQKAVRFKNLGLVVIDEQHRFGVAQRANLRGKGLRPDVLLMTATPIPRTLALTDYAELNVSKIKDLPPGRKPIRTVTVPESDRENIYKMLRKELEAGRQVYVIYPLIEESENVDLKSATEMAGRLQKEAFKSYRVGLLHGKLKQEVKDQVMEDFVRGEIQVLVSTTVVEVGVDVPNASAMVIENSERFGLSQLHQLRGRIGRGPWESHCILFYRSSWTHDARERLKTMSLTQDGFLIAEKDLELRGPGDFFGTRQSGVPKFRAGDIMRDREIMEEAHLAARQVVDKDQLTPELHEFILKDWERQFGLVGMG